MHSYGMVMLASVLGLGVKVCFACVPACETVAAGDRREQVEARIAAIRWMSSQSIK